MVDRKLLMGLALIISIFLVMTVMAISVARGDYYSGEDLEGSEDSEDSEDTSSFMDENRDRIILSSAVLGLLLSLVELFRFMKDRLKEW